MKQTIEIIPFSEYAAEFNPIRAAKTLVPDWYKTSKAQISSNYLTPEGVPTSTYKKCSPFLDALTAGYVAVLTSDVEFIFDEQGATVLNRSLRTIITPHSNDQWEGLIPPEGYAKTVLKWNQDIVLKTPKNISCLFTHPLNRFDLPFQTISGIVDTDIYPMPVHFPFWVRTGFKGVIPMGTPVAQIIPFRNEQWTTSNIDYDPKRSYVSREQWANKIVRSYKNQWWRKKTYDTE